MKEGSILTLENVVHPKRLFCLVHCHTVNIGRAHALNHMSGSVARKDWK